MSSKIVEVGLGCDPEFILEDKGGCLVSAGNVLIGNSAFGCDGCSAVGEIRPGYSADVFEVSDKIRQVMDIAYSKSETLRDLRWLAGHYKHGYPIGGHIHIAFKNASVHTKTLARYYDVYLSDALSDLIDPIAERDTRRRTAYGNKYEVSRNAIETKGDSRFEYRTPGSWLISPLVAIANLAVAKMVTIGFTQDVLPDSVPRNKAEDKRKAIDNLWSIIKDIPEDCKTAHAIVQKVIYNENAIDWNTDFKESWL